MKKNKVLIYSILIFTLFFFTASLVNKTMQNDTFFYIPIGERIAKTYSIDGLDHWSFHENLRFTYPGWVCNLTMYFLYNSFGFSGIYIFVMIMAGLIAIVFFANLLKGKNNLIISFVIALLTIYISNGIFAARNQIFSFLLFELEVFCLIGLLEQGKKRYFWFLLMIAFLLVLVHDTLYIMFWVLMLPYFVDFILSKIFKFEKNYKLKSSNLKNIKYLIILLILSIPIGFCTPIFASTYTNLINCMNGVSTEIIQELKPVNFIQDVNLLTITFIFVGLLAFTKTKFKIKDVLFVFGFLISAMMAGRNVYFLYLIGLIYLTNMFTECINTYVDEEKTKSFLEKFKSSKCIIIGICCFISIMSVKNMIYQIAKEYVSNIFFPTKATEWILENIDYEDARIWTSFNWGSYLELKGIKVFIDSRSGMYTEQENKGVTVLNDWHQISTDNADYHQVFEKYKITHCLVENSEKLSKKLANDEDYNIIYQDNLYSLYVYNKNY